MKIFKPCLFLLALLLTPELWAQNLKPVASRIQEAKNNADFTTNQVENLLLVNRTFNSNNLIGEEIKGAVYFDFNNSASAQLIGASPEFISLEIPSNGRGQSIILDLAQVPLSFYDYQVVTSSGERFSGDPSNGLHYQGVVRGSEASSVVSLSIFHDELMGVISIEGNGNYNLGKVGSAKTHVFYKDTELKSLPAMSCDTPDDFGHYDKGVIMNSSKQRAAAKCVKFYFETEYDIYQNKGSVTNVVNYITGLYNQVATLYGNESIQTKISQIKVWNTNDPYTATNTASLLSQFQGQISSFNGDLGQLLTFRSVGGGRAAGFSGICNSNVDQKLSVSGIYSTYSNVPTYSWSVMVVTHEFGHLFGSRHTHACVWNGNNTAIDGCSGFTEGSCPLPGVPSGGGTLMSYCHIKPVGINFSLGFGPQPGNVIRNSVANGSCIGSCTACPANLSVTQNVNSGTIDNQQASNTLTASNKIFNNGTANYKAGVRVRLVTGFRAYAGSKFRAYIAGCSTFGVVDEDEVITNEAEESGTIESAILSNSDEALAFNVFPNPTNGKITIDHAFETDSAYDVNLYDFKGKLVLSKKISGDNKDLSLNELNNGIYLVKIVSNNRYFAKKIILNR